MDGEVDAAVEHGLAQRRDEDAGSPEVAQGAGLVAIALGADGDELDGDAGQRGDPFGHLGGLGDGERTRPGAEPQDGLAHGVAHGASLPTWVTASTAAGSSANRSERASAYVRLPGASSSCWTRTVGAWMSFSATLRNPLRTSST